ncbi:hypothetical protein [Candidatus Bathycorpusculum sp.]|uniref:hypothetical protein n=1 Tax=Candidatus Bathycorpusculum sp. TaxID=2994959 RepID=UPI0028207C93|nr:hypothetical protein [Candidatus Termitimicrobium sp.]MCL2686153.1 hypothetical protein [Candidatus Termitimicrobium sp.]
MFKQQQEDTSSLTSLSPEIQSPNKKRHRSLYYAIFAVFVVLIVICAALLIPQSGGSSLELRLNYAVGERMVYETTITTGQTIDESFYPITTSLTTIMDVLSENSENYTINQAITTNPNIGFPGSFFPIDVSKATYYNNFMVPGAPLIFNNTDSNPTILAYLAQSSVKVGDVWIVPVNISTANVGMTGKVTLKFAEIQEITVPAGTFQTMRIEITSTALNIHAYGNSNDDPLITILSTMSTQINGTSYIELGTCRLIKADLTQLVTMDSSDIERTSYTEQILMEYTKP